jgi:hypothetical protein
MSFRKRLLLLSLGVLILGALDALLAPFFIPPLLRFWLEQSAKEQGLRIEIGRIEAPFLQPVTIDKLRIVSPPGAARELSLEAQLIVTELNFRGQIFSRPSAFIRGLKIGRLEGSAHLAGRRSGAKKFDWRLLARCLPDNFRIERADLDLSAADLALGLHEMVLSGSAIEAGKFSAREVTIRSPILRQRFRDLGGATAWESNRLTIAGIPLLHGLDLETLTIDLSHLARRRVGVDLQLDAYGGTLRASAQGRAGAKFTVDLAGSAASISLSQLASAFGLVEPVAGRLRAAKFTFRGNPGEFLDATASVWMELGDFAWRARRADNVMLGATYYDRRLEVDQFYVRQRENQLTASGQMFWPKKGRKWLELPFRGELNATIPDLNSLATLFGATTGDFAGALIAEGKIDTLSNEARGELDLRGKAVGFRGVTLDSLGASLRLQGSEVTLEKLEARRAQDFIRGEGEIDLHGPHRFSGRLTGAMNDLAGYASLLPSPWQESKIAGGATFDWRGDGTLEASSGTMQLYAHALQLPVAPFRLPLDLTLDGSYSPQDVFFRTFQLGNDRVWLGGFLMLGRNFIELQSMQLSLEGTPRVTGKLFLPISANRWRLSGSLLDALDEKQKVDLDFSIDRLDLGKLSQALGEKFTLGGVLDGRLAAFGSLGELEATGSLRLENFGTGSPEDFCNVTGRYAAGRATIESSVGFGRSAPLTMEVSLPVQLEKEKLKSAHALDPAAPFSCDFRCPALFLEDLPDELRPWAGRGLLTGELTISHSLGTPQIEGEMQLIEGHFRPPPPWSEWEEVSADLRWRNNLGLISPLEAEVGGHDLLFSGRLTTAPPEFRLVLEPARGELTVSDLPPSGSNLSSIRVVGEGNEEWDEARLRRLVVRGSIGSAAASVTLYSEATAANQSLMEARSFFLRPRSMRGEPLLLRLVPPPPVSLGQPNERQIRWP